MGDYRLGSNGYMVHRLNPRRYEHRDVWSAINGPIPYGHHIHHINKNRTDNRPENLLCIDANEHMRLHGLDPVLVKKWNKGKKRMPLRALTCPSCDKEFKSRSPVAKFCSFVCTKKHNNWIHGIKRGVKREERSGHGDCPECMKHFKKNRPFQKFCCKQCGIIAHNRKAKLKKAA